MKYVCMNQALTAPIFAVAHVPGLRRHTYSFKVGIGNKLSGMLVADVGSGGEHFVAAKPRPF